jgi:hypothetical protein
MDVLYSRPHVPYRVLAIRLKLGPNLAFHLRLIAFFLNIEVAIPNNWRPWSQLQFPWATTSAPMVRHS